jgi:hypothetical protein
MEMEITEELYAEWYEWVCKGNRNPFDDREDRIEQGKYLAYYSYWDNASDIKRAHLTDFDIERMEEDPNADGIHWGAMEAAKDWGRSALAAIEDGREPEDHWL